MRNSWQSAAVIYVSLIAPMLLAQQAAPDPASLATIEGKTIGTDGQPLRKSNLTLRPIQIGPLGGERGGAGVVGGGPQQPPTPYAATSDAQGNFSFTGLEAGRYTLMAEHPGYINTTYGVKRTAGALQNNLITLTAGQHMTNVTLEMTPQSTMSGKVTDEDGDPLPRISVRAMRRQYAGGGARMLPAGNSITDDQGQFKITGLQAGRYYLMFMPQRIGPVGARRAGAPPGEQEMDYATLYYPGAPDTSTAMAVDVAAGQDRQGMNLQMRKMPVYHIRGKVQGDLPVASGPNDFSARLQVMVTPAGGDVIGGLNSMRQANPDGTFDVAGLTPGSWVVSAIRAQGQAETFGSTLVQIGNRDVSDLVLNARSPMDVTGTVKIVPDNYVPPAAAAALPTIGGTQFGGPQGQQAGATPRVGQVSLQAVDSGIGGNVNAAVQPDGSFTLKGVGSLRYRVMVQANQPGYLKSAMVGGQDVLVSGWDARNGGGPLSIVYSMSAATIDGTVTLPDGPPAANTMVTLVPDPVQPERTNLYKQGQTDASGKFTLRGVPPGKYRLYAWEDLQPGAYMDPDYIKPFESLGASVSVDENDHGQVSLKQITSVQVADVDKRAGR